jgi:hypothetical protein
MRQLASTTSDKIFKKIPENIQKYLLDRKPENLPNKILNKILKNMFKNTSSTRTRRGGKLP